MSLSRSSLPLLDIENGITTEPITRRDYLARALTTRRNFLYRKKPFYFLPVTADADLYAGLIGREIREINNLPPEQGFELVEENKWKAAYIFFDARENKQIAIFESNNKVGLPRGLLQAFLENQRQDIDMAAWTPHVEYISSAPDFWVAVEEYLGRITSLNFTFLPPNALRASEAVDDLVRAASEQANASSTDLRLRNPDGKLEPRGELVETALATATKGGGDVSMKVGTKIVYSSATNKETREVQPEEMPRPSAKDKVIAMGRKLLGL